MRLVPRYVCFIILLVALPLFAQTSTGNIYGTITDSGGEPLPGVTVSINAGGLQQTFVTEQGGQFHFLRLPPGRYRVSASLEGMGAVQRDAEVNIGTNATVDLRISPQVSETMTVTAAVPLVDTRETGT